MCICIHMCASYVYMIIYDSICTSQKTEMTWDWHGERYPASWVPYRGFDVITRHLWWAHWQKPEIFREKTWLLRSFKRWPVDEISRGIFGYTTERVVEKGLGNLVNLRKHHRNSILGTHCRSFRRHIPKFLWLIITFSIFGRYFDQNNWKNIKKNPKNFT